MLRSVVDLYSRVGAGILGLGHVFLCLIEVEGEEKDLDHFTLLCGEGTPYSFITDMKIEAVTPTGKYVDFQEIR